MARALPVPLRSAAGVAIALVARETGGFAAPPAHARELERYRRRFVEPPDFPPRFFPPRKRAFEPRLAVLEVRDGIRELLSATVR